MSNLPQSSNSAMKVLIVGAGCAGPAFAHLLQKSCPKHTITVIERSPRLRTGGQQLDLKRNGIPIAKYMGILESLKAAGVHETGMQLVDKKGTSLLQFGINSSSRQTQGFTLTNEYEIMRGDMVKIFYDASLAERHMIEARGEKEGGLTYKFDTTITHLEQSGKGATVTFSNGEKAHYDLVVAADGQNSRTRGLAFSDEINANCFRSMYIQAAYFDVPRIESDHSDAKIFFSSQSRMIMTRTGDRPTTQVYVFLMRDRERHERMRSVDKQPLELQKKAWIEILQDAGWECERFARGLKTTEDFYATEIGQVHMPQLHSGRVVLLGDSGYCPSPFTGMGTTLALVGSYILAGELAKHGNNVEAALQAYHDTMQEPIKEYQTLTGGAESKLYPASEVGIMIVNNLLWTLSSLRIDKVLQWMVSFLPERKTDLELPGYPGLTLENEKKL